jgi:hypothetical protein
MLYELPAKEAILIILIEKIYPRKPALMRNDAKTARILKRYIDAIIVEFRKPDDDFHHFTTLRAEANRLYAIVKPLNNIQEDTIRRIIAKLWETGAISAFIDFKKVN